MKYKLLTMEMVSKSFSGVDVQKGARFELERGEVHALMGGNGAGKSVLMKILTGIHTRDSGTITFEGKPVIFKNPREAQDAGIVLVHQELQRMPHLTVAQNIFIGREATKGRWVIDDEDSNRRAAALFQLLHIDIDPREKVGNLTVSRQQLEEIATMTDRVTIMWDGEYVETLITKETNKSEIIDRMIGRVVYETPKEKSMVPEDARRTETARAVFGAEPYDSGTVLINGQQVEILSARDAIAHGICYLSEDRKRYGVALSLGIGDNMSMPNLEAYSRLGIKAFSSRQKVVIAKWLIRNCQILIFDEPTQGIDVGGKNEIYKMMQGLAAAGKSIIMISSDQTEICCHRLQYR